MTFNRRDLEDDDFSFDDEVDNNGEPFDFGDEPEDIGLDEQGFDFEEDMPIIEEEGEEGGGPNRTFVIIAALMIGLFVIGLIVVLVLVSRPQAPTPTQLTATFIVQQNATVEAQLILTQTAAVIIAQQLTQTAAVPPTDTPLPTDTPIPSPTDTPTLDPTELAAQALQTQTALELTQTAEFLLTPPTQEALGPSDVALTATALAILLAPPTPGQGGGEATPTPEGLVPTAGVPPTALPQTGFFDDLGAGGANMGAFALMALGLLAVIVVSRRLRANDR
ncbi:MAG: hypothetical protein HXY41_04155 [Chloroflexi bacterium]|nr:hypothetical protein [Chloroflexota bacterium]